MVEHHTIQFYPFGEITKEIIEKARRIRLLLTDNDGVLTDTGVYYSDAGEKMKRFSIRDGMGVERLQRLAEVETGIVTGEISAAVRKRAEKLNIRQCYLGIKDKAALLNSIFQQQNLNAQQVAYIGDDTNDIEIMKHVGLSACPVDAIWFVREIADVICRSRGGNGAFREFAELIIAARSMVISK